MMDRTKLLNKLEIVAPALSDNDLIPILTHLWFLGDAVMAFNDQIAIRTPLSTTWKGAVPGRTMMALLSASIAKEVDLRIDNEGTHLLMKSGADCKLGLIGPDSFVFSIPERPPKHKINAKSKPFLDALALCLGSTSADTSVPDQLGITLIPKPKEVLMFATNGATLAQARVPTTEKPEYSRVILSSLFCKQVLRLAEKADVADLHIGENHTILNLDGHTTVFGRTIHSSHPLDYEGVFNHHVKDAGALIKIPPKLDRILQRAIIVTESKMDESRTAIKCSNGAMEFDSTSKRGEVRDTLKKIKHPSVRVKLNPKLLRAGLETFDKFLITDRCAIMQKDHLTYLVSATAGDD